MTLQDLPDSPRFIFNATNFSTGVDFRFSKPYAGDYRIGLIRQPKFRVSLAVAASSAFPSFLSPVVIKTDPNAFERTEGADLFDAAAYRERLVLTDGGVYDNLGLETVWKRLDTILASDAGAPFNFAPNPAHGWFRQSLRTLDIAVNQARTPEAAAHRAPSAMRAQGGLLGDHDRDREIPVAGRPPGSARGHGETGPYSHSAQPFHGRRAVLAYQLGLRDLRCCDATVRRIGSPRPGWLAVSGMRARPAAQS